VVGNGSSFLAEHFKISGCFKTELLAMPINYSYSLIEKSSTLNEPMIGFLSQLLSVWFGGKYFWIEFYK